MIKVEDEYEQSNERPTKAIEDKTKPSYNQASDNAMTTQNDPQISIDGNTYKDNEIKIKIEMEESSDSFYNMLDEIKEEENDPLKEHLSNDFQQSSCFQISYNSSAATRNSYQQLLDRKTNNVGETCNEIIVKVEADLVDGNYFESVIEVEKHWLLDNTMNYDSDKIRTYGCDLCQKSCSTKKKVARHMTESHGVNSTQENTRKQVVRNTLSNQKASKKINETSKQLRSFQCNYCHKSYNTKRQIELHIVQDHKSTLNNISLQKPQQRKRFTEEFKSFSQKGNLKIHNRLHTEKKSYKCSICLKLFSLICNLKQHQRVHTGEKPYKCDVCLKSFLSKIELVRHKRIHTGEKPYTCNICFKSFSNNSNIKTHKRVHTAEKPYKCDVCLKTFSLNNNLKTHKRLHTGEKPYKCPVCNKSFSDGTTLRRHKQWHTGEKPYNCDMCSKSFSRKSRLKSHELLHTGVRPFKCDLCCKTYTIKDNLTTHKRVHH
ncbi:zinc finger protein 761-like [Adelges cooleyi]|uniref:zinc finger protein 761-like n=1 Tax=Adelges cooleyi TaxID=133065 RepID=UPI00217F5F10|nr:zinc finger protein 761-like [Adelges cooleyi]